LAFGGTDHTSDFLAQTLTTLFGSSERFIAKGYSYDPLDAGEKNCGATGRQTCPFCGMGENEIPPCLGRSKRIQRDRWFNSPTIEPLGHMGHFLPGRHLWVATNKIRGPFRQTAHDAQFGFRGPRNKRGERGFLP